MELNLRGGNSNLPIGTILPYIGDDIPTGFLKCNGGELNRTTYTRLFNKVGVKYTPTSNLYKLGSVRYSATPPTYNSSNFCITPTGSSQYIIPPQTFNSSNFELYIVIYTHQLKDNNRFLCYHSTSHEGFELEFSSSTLRLVYSTNGSNYATQSSTWNTAYAYTWYAIHIKVNETSYIVDYAPCGSPKEYGTKEDVTKLQYTNCIDLTLNSPIYTSEEMYLSYGCNERRNTEWFGGEIDLLRTTPSCCIDNEEKNTSFNLPKGFVPLDDTIPLVGTGIVIGLTDGVEYVGLGNSSDAPNHLAARKNSYGEVIGAYTHTAVNLGKRNVGLTDQKEKSGIAIKKGETYQQANYIIKY